jgi:pimeloyl-ACP methyl ester carboxylesterase
VSDQVAEGRPGITVGEVVANGVRLHRTEAGSGPAVVFVHMGGRDYRYWDAQMLPFAASGYRAVSYSRRFAFPNENPPAPAYSPRTDAFDLAALIEASGLAPANVVASSIGAVAALFLAVERPELVRALVLAEPPLLPWAAEAPGGARLVAAFLEGVWRPAGAAFRQGDARRGIRLLMDYFVGAGAFDAFPARLAERVMANIPDWAAHTTSRDPFPALDREAVRAAITPALMLSGGRTLPMHRIIDAELESLLAHGRRVLLPDASHDVWGDAPERCRELTLRFLADPRGGGSRGDA